MFKQYSATNWWLLEQKDTGDMGDYWRGFFKGYYRDPFLTSANTSLLGLRDIDETLQSNFRIAWLCSIQSSKNAVAICQFLNLFALESPAESFRGPN